MEDSIKTLQAELDVFIGTRESLIKQGDIIKKQIKAKDKQIKAQQELISSITPAAAIGNPEEKTA